MEKDEREIIQKMKDVERERTTAELEAWQLKQKDQVEEEAPHKHQSQADDQKKLKVGKGNHQKGRSRIVKLGE